MNRLVLLAPWAVALLLENAGCGAAASGSDADEREGGDEAGRGLGRSLAEPAVDEHCRTFASGGTITLGQRRGTIECAYDANANELGCEVVAGELSTTLRSAYASLADFVEEADRVGRTTRLREVRIDDGASRSTSHHYDELGRLLRSHEVSPEGQRTRSFSDHDAAGRPRREVWSFPHAVSACEGLQVRISYDDVGRTVARDFPSPVPAGCELEAGTQLERYDDNGNLVASGEGSSDAFQVVPLESETLCVE